MTDLNVTFKQVIDSC